MDNDDANLRPTQRPEWVLQRLRRALADEVERSLLADGRKQTWPGVSEAILERTGVSFPHERLRQFVYGVNKDGRLHYTRPREDRVEAAIAWVTDSEGDDPILPLSVLEREELAIKPPLCLADVVILKSDVRAPASKLVGTFEAEKRGGDTQESVSLALSEFSSPGFLQVRETRIVMSEGKQRTIQSAGWSIVTAEDQLLVFMREVDGTLNHRWLLVSDADLWTDAPATGLTLLRQAYPYDRYDGAIAKALERDLFQFQRRAS